MAAKASSSGTKRSAAASSSSTSSGSAAKKVKPNATLSSAAEDASIPLGKALASTEKRVRDGAVRSLHAYLSTNGAHTIPELELKQLWKGLFYCFWMSDKPLIQQRLANDLADLVLVHPSSPQGKGERVEAGIKFLECFWDTLVGEWAGLDKHRIDKYYLLVRRFVAAGFRLLAEENWPQQGVQELGRILGKFPGGVLGTNDPKVPDSLTYHLCDIYLDELEKVIESHQDESNADLDEEDAEKEEEEEEELPLVPTMELLTPFVDALATAKSKAMYDRIWSNVFEPLLEDTLRASARDEDDFDQDDDEEQDEDLEDDDEEHDSGEEGGDETANGTEFHSFADESTLTAQADDESEPSLPDSDDDSDEDDDEDDVRYPLLLALSAVPTPTGKDAEDLEEIDEDQADVALVLRKAIFQALFKAASRKDATEARRRLLYQLWRDEQDRLNDTTNDDEDQE